MDSLMQLSEVVLVCYNGSAHATETYVSVFIYDDGITYFQIDYKLEIISVFKSETV
jgi:hypothetical protein